MPVDYLEYIQTLILTHLSYVSIYSTGAIYYTVQIILREAFIFSYVINNNAQPRTLFLNHNTSIGAINIYCTTHQAIGKFIGHVHQRHHFGVALMKFKISETILIYPLF